MAKGLYQHIRSQWKTDAAQAALKQKIMVWRKQRTVERIDKPTRLDRARSLGYKAKTGYVIARVRMKKGGRTRPTYSRGRKPIHAGLTKFTPKKSLRGIAEQRAVRRFTSMEVLNSYEVADAGDIKFFEVILVDPRQPSIRSDPKIKWICSPTNRGRAMRGLTSVGKKARGLR